MSRKRRGGPRQATVGKTYTNRTDLQLSPQRQQQRVASPPPTTPSATMPTLAAPPPLNAPTQRPNEPITAGLPIGNGAGPQAIQAPIGSQGTLVAQLTALYRAFPNEDVRRLLAKAQANDPLYNDDEGTTRLTPKARRWARNHFVPAQPDNRNRDMGLDPEGGVPVPMPTLNTPFIDQNFGAGSANDTWGGQRPIAEA